MSMPPSHRLIVILKATLNRVEEQFGPNDPTFLQLKSSLVRAISELGIERVDAEKIVGNEAMPWLVDLPDISKPTADFERRLEIGYPYRIRSSCKLCGASRLVSVADGSLQSWELTHNCRAAAKTA